MTEDELKIMQPQTCERHAQAQKQKAYDEWRQKDEEDCKAHLLSVDEPKPKETL